MKISDTPLFFKDNAPYFTNPFLFMEKMELKSPPFMGLIQSSLACPISQC